MTCMVLRYYRLGTCARPLYALLAPSATWWLGVLALEAQFSDQPKPKNVRQTSPFMTEGVKYLAIFV